MKEFAKVFWVIDDVFTHAEEKGISITDDEAREFLERHEESIADNMVATGWNVIAERFWEDFGNRKSDDAA